MISNPASNKPATKGKQESSDSEGSPPPLLFINKDIHNLSRTSAEVFAVGSHVSRGSRKWKKSKSSLALDSSTGKILASSGIPVPQQSRAPSPAAGKPVTLRWRIDDGVNKSSVTKSKKRSQRSTASPKTTPASTPAAEIRADPFACSLQPPMLDHNLTALVSFYLQIIQPFTEKISTEWTWLKDEDLIKSSTALTYAVCAYASAFRSGVQDGLKGLVLPPVNEMGTSSLWPVPEWFRLQAKAISELRQHLSTEHISTKQIQEADVHAVVFLMRLQVLLCERNWASLHLQAITEMADQVSNMPNLFIDTAMWKINLIAAFLDRAYLSKNPSAQIYEHSSTNLLTIDFSQIANPDDRVRVSSSLRNREILWRPQPPQVLDEKNPTVLTDEDLQVDTAFVTSEPSARIREIRVCTQIARYLTAYLTHISYDTSLPKIRELAQDLQRRLSALLIEPRLLRSRPKLLVFMAFAGALASRGYEEQKFYIEQLAFPVMTVSLERYKDLAGALSSFIDISIMHESLLKGIWERTVQRRSGRS